MYSSRVAFFNKGISQNISKFIGNNEKNPEGRLISANSPARAQRVEAGSHIEVEHVEKLVGWVECGSRLFERLKELLQAVYLRLWH